MPAQSTIEVCPPQTLSESAAAAGHLTAAAEPATKASPASGGGGVSLADIAAAALAAKVTAHLGELSGKIAGKAPNLQTHTESGVWQLEQTDDVNAEQLRALGVEAQQTYSRLV
jgi:hypothetical protein